MRIQYRIFIFLVPLFIFSSCLKEETHLNISGQVTNAATGEGLSSATVSLKKMHLFTADILAQAMSDNEGYYHISYTEEGYCPESLLMLRAERYGFISITDSDSGSTRLMCIDGHQSINFPLKLQK